MPARRRDRPRHLRRRDAVADDTSGVSKSKFTPSTFGDTVDSIYDAGTISSGDSRISVVPSFSVPAGGSYDLTVTINPAHSNGAIEQGWINLNGPGANDLRFAYYAHVGP
jgi:hypothetical protein